MICRAGAAGLGTPLTRELNCTHRWPQHLSFVGMQAWIFFIYFFCYLCNSLQRNTADDKASQIYADGSDQTGFVPGAQRSRAAVR